MYIPAKYAKYDDMTNWILAPPSAHALNSILILNHIWHAGGPPDIVSKNLSLRSIALQISELWGQKSPLLIDKTHRLYNSL